MLLGLALIRIGGKFYLLVSFASLFIAHMFNCTPSFFLRILIMMLQAMKDEIGWMIQCAVSQTLPYRDRSGRTILFGDPSRKDMTVYSTHRQMMAMWYTMETIIEDEESRNRGLVVLTTAKTYSSGSGMDLKFTRYTIKLIGDIFPVHLRSIHFCHPSKVAHYVIFPALKFVLGKNMRLRFNTHYGTDTEVMMQLETFGLHRSILPAELAGDVLLDYQQWIHERLSKEYSDEALGLGALSSGLPPSASAAVAQLAAAGAQPSVAAAAAADSGAGLDALSLAALVAQPVVTEGDASKLKRRHSHTEEGGHRHPFKLTRQSTKDLADLEEILNDTEIPKSGKKKVGRRADPRMNRSVRIKLRNPETSPLDALLQGGYDYPIPAKGSSAHEIFDSDNVSLHQRKNQLCRRVRQLREKQQRDEAKATTEAAEPAKSSESSSTPAEMLCGNHAEV